MKTLILLGITILAFNTKASDKVSNAETAKQVAISIEKSEFRNLGTSLDIQIFSVIEKGNKVKVETAIGTTERPARMNNCITLTFSGVGYIKNIEKTTESYSCEF